MLVHCNAVNNSYQRNSGVLYAFVSNKSFDQVLEISPRNYVLLKTCNSKFFNIEV